MNAKRLFYLLLALPLLFSACKETPEPTPAPAPKPELKLVSEATVAFDAEGGAGTIVYELKNAVEGTVLTATEEAEWISDVIVGETVTYFVEANESEEARTATITLAYGTLAPIDVTINQAGTTNDEPEPGPEPTTIEFEMSYAERIPSHMLELENNVVCLYMCDDAENVEFGVVLVGEEGTEILMPGTYTVADQTVLLEEAGLTVYEPAAEYIFTDATVNVTVTDEEEGIYAFDMLFTAEDETIVKVTYEGVVMNMEPMPAPQPETINPVSIEAEYFETGNFYLWIWVDAENGVYHGLDMYDQIAPNDNYLSAGHYSMEDGTIDDWSEWGLFADGYAMNYPLTAAEIDLIINDDKTVTLKGYLESELGHHGDIDWTGTIEGFSFEVPDPISVNFTEANVTKYEWEENNVIEVTFANDTDTFAAYFNVDTKAIETGTYAIDGTYDTNTVTAKKSKFNGTSLSEGGEFIITRENANYQANMNFFVGNQEYLATFEGNIALPNGTLMGAPEAEQLNNETVYEVFAEYYDGAWDVYFCENEANGNDVNIIDFIPAEANPKLLVAGEYSTKNGTIGTDYSFYHNNSTAKENITEADITVELDTDAKTASFVGSFTSSSGQKVVLNWSGKVAGFDFSTDEDSNNFTEWASNSNIKTWSSSHGDREYMFCGYSADGSLEINLDCYAYPANSDKVMPAGVYNVESFKTAADYAALGKDQYLYCSNTSYGYLNTIRFDVVSGTIEVKHHVGEYEIILDITTSTGKNIKGTYIGTAGEYGSAKNPTAE